MKIYLSNASSLLCTTPHDPAIDSFAGRKNCKSHSTWPLATLKRVIFAVLVIGMALYRSSICEAQQDGPLRAQVEIHFRQAENYLTAHNPDLAASEFKTILAISPGNTAALANLGVIAFMQNDCPTAISDLNGALKNEPQLTRAQALLAICEWRLRDPSAQALLQASFSQLQDKKIRTEVGIELASSYYQHGDLEHASSITGALLQINPDDVDVLYLAQRTYQEMADDTLNKLAMLAPNSARMQQIIAERLINSGNATGAIEHYRAALKIGESLMQVSTAEISLADAQREFSESIQSDGDSARIEEQMGLIAVLRSHFNEAYQYYKRAIALNPNDTDAQLGLAKILMDTQKRMDPQKTKEAIAYLQNVLNADPMNTDARYHIAMAYKQLGSSEESRKQLGIFLDSKAVKSQVESIYAEMNRPMEKPPGSQAEEEKVNGVKQK
jgi:tetratricopeptide (TPR) repeat protein